MNFYLIPAHLKKLSSVKDKKNILYIYKGFPNHFLQKLSEDIPHINSLEIIADNQTIPLEELIKDAPATLSKLKKSKEKKLFILYEEFLLIPSDSIATLPFTLKIIINNFYEYYPNQSNLIFPDIENSINSDIDFEENATFSRFYADSRHFAGTPCIQYLDYPTDIKTLGIEMIPFFDASEITLPDFKTDISEGSDTIQFQASDSSYFNLKLAVFNNTIPAQINLIVDESIQHIPKDLQELKILFHLLSSADCKITLFNQPKTFIDFWRPELDDLLHKHWGEKASFKKLNIYKNPDTNKELIEHSQGSVVEHIIQQVEKAKANLLFEDIFLTAPTGAGKSLLFQLPAIFLSESEKLKSVTIVVSPLKALMYDQVQALITDRNFDKVAFVNSDLSLIERQEILDKTMKGELSVLYLSPELLLSYELSTFIGSRELGLLVIDEAHLVTTWGRDFRIDYWFLGSYIRKLRGNGTIDPSKNKSKVKTYRFPVVALTATAVYNGEDDMVFDTIRTLNMQNCRTYIGSIKRPEIGFEYHPFDIVKVHETDKMEKTKERIREFITKDKKAIFYFPWASHIKNLTNTLGEELKSKVKRYYGELSPSLRKETLSGFKSGQTKVVLATKAFGMGVDISDIEIVYHHAPSGSLADYVQEIGRVARIPGMKGTAILDFNPKDLRFTKVLFFLSALKQFQVELVLKKLDKLYQLNQERNMLVSVENFNWIFSNDKDPEQKVKSALLIIEKDLLDKYGYNVMMVKPKSMLSSVFCSVDDEGYDILKEKFGNYIEEVKRTKYDRAGVKLKNGAIVMREEKEDRKNIKIVLDKLWEDHFPGDSFPDLRTKFFEKRLFPYVEPLMKMKIYFTGTIASTGPKLENGINFIGNTINSMGGKMFKKEDLVKQFQTRIKNETTCTKLADLLCTFFAETDSFGQKGKPGMSTGTFLKAKSNGFMVQYFFDQIAFSRVTTQLMRNYLILFDGINEKVKTYTGFIPADVEKAKEKLKMIYLLELFELSTYEISGGESPQLLVRINDPEKINALCKEKNPNNVVNEIERKHNLSMETMTYFFQNEMKDEERWNYIEDYFLGNSISKETSAQEPEPAENME